MGGKGNEGVANYVQRIKGSIGYVEYAYAKRNKMSHVAMKNHDGQFVQPDDSAFAAAAANAKWGEVSMFYEILTDEPGAKSWPITGASFILVPTEPKDPARTAEALKFFAWSFANGDKMAEDLDYVPMPEAVTKLIEQMWRSDIKGVAAALGK